MIDTFLRPKIIQFVLVPEEDEVWFEQDGATAHIARRFMENVKRVVPWTSCFFKRRHFLAIRSSDLSPCDFFLWGYLKAEVYKHRPRTLQELKDVIRQEVAANPMEMLYEEL